MKDIDYGWKGVIKDKFLRLNQAKNKKPRQTNKDDILKKQLELEGRNA